MMGSFSMFWYLFCVNADRLDVRGTHIFRASISSIYSFVRVNTGWIIQ